jgi:hypothetical protein
VDCTTDTSEFNFRQGQLGFWQVRLRSEDLAARRLGLHQPAIVAAAIGVLQRLADRHESGLSLRSRSVHDRRWFRASSSAIQARYFLAGAL